MQVPGVLVVAAIVVAAIGFGNALVDLITLAGVGAIVYCIVRYYRNRLSQRDDAIKDREAKIRLLEHDLGRIEGLRNKAESELAGYRAQLDGDRKDSAVSMRKITNEKI